MKEYFIKSIWFYKCITISKYFRMQVIKMNIKEMEQLINQISSVISCKIVIDDQNNIQEIHVLSNVKRGPKQISRDIQSILISKFGLNIDYKKISVAQIDENMSEDIDFRLKLSSIQYSLSESKAIIKVTLEKEGKHYEGQASGIQTKHNSEKMIATATLKAVENFLGIEDMFIIEDLKTVNIAHRDVVVTAIIYINEYEEQFFTGCASVNRDKKEAIVKSTLDGINRKIMKYYNEN